MISINNPFDESAFSKETKILLDACILLALIDADDIMNANCQLEIDKLDNQDARFYVSNVVLAEVINKTISKLFTYDMQSIWSQTTPLNTTDNVLAILSTMFNNRELTLLTDTSSSVYSLKNIPYTRYFNMINKGKTTLDRSILQIYFTEALRLLTDLENKYDLKTLIINENMMNMARDLMDKYMLGINDTQHLATALGYRVNFIMSTDGDFELIGDDYKVQVLKIS